MSQSPLDVPEVPDLIVEALKELKFDENASEAQHPTLRGKDLIQNLKAKLETLSAEKKEMYTMILNEVVSAYSDPNNAPATPLTIFDKLIERYQKNASGAP